MGTRQLWGDGIVERMVNAAFRVVLYQVLGRRSRLLRTEVLVQPLTVDVQVLLHRLLLLFECLHHDLGLFVRSVHGVKLLSVPVSALIADSEILWDLDVSCRPSRWPFLY